MLPAWQDPSVCRRTTATWWCTRTTAGAGGPPERRRAGRRRCAVGAGSHRMFLHRAADAAMACLEATDLHVLVRRLRVAAPRVALEVRAQRHDVVEPERRDVERVARFEDGLEAPHL